MTAQRKPTPDECDAMLLARWANAAAASNVRAKREGWYAKTWNMRSTVPTKLSPTRRAKSQIKPMILLAVLDKLCTTREMHELHPDVRPESILRAAKQMEGSGLLLSELVSFKAGAYKLFKLTPAGKEAALALRDQLDPDIMARVRIEVQKK